MPLISKSVQSKQELLLEPLTHPLTLLRSGPKHVKLRQTNNVIITKMIPTHPHIKKKKKNMS